MIVCLDFDGCIVEDRFPDIGPLMPGVEGCLHALHADGAEFIVSSCRNRVNFIPPGAQTDFDDPRLWAPARCPFTEMQAFLFSVFPFVKVDDGTTGKVFAHVYLDDRGLFWEPDWHEIYRRLKRKLVLK